MIELSREHLGALVSAGQAVLPVLVRHGDPHVAWDVAEALNAAEAALLADEREESDNPADNISAEVTPCRVID